MGLPFIKPRQPPQPANLVDRFEAIDPTKAPNVKQYLRGVRNYFVLSQTRRKPYAFFYPWMAACSAYVLVQSLKHYLFQTEYDMRKQPNPFVPKRIYDIRREHYIYWEISRLARGLPKTFTYSTWDPKARMMYHVDMEGKVSFEKLNLREERLDLLQNPLLGPLLRRRDELEEDELMFRRANKIAIYYLNKDKKYDLDNYLLQKWITPFDWLRAFWYTASIAVGYADTYRNEQFVPRTDWWYNHEAKMLAINFDNPSQERLATNLLWALSCEQKQLFVLIQRLDAQLKRWKIVDSGSGSE